MKTALGLLLLLSLPLGATPILYPTGVDNSFAVLGDGAIDPHYTVAGYGTASVLTSGILPGVWVGGAGSKWIWQNSNGQPSDWGGLTRTIETTFDLTGTNPATAHIWGTWAADNKGAQILINGVAVSGIVSPDYTSYKSFDITAADFGANPFLAGENRISFVIEDWGYMGGFRVDTIQVTATSSTASTPEPAAMALMGGGLLALVAVSRRRMRR